jgi:hypothetical protein
MSKFTKFSMFGVLFVMILTFAISTAPAKAAENTFGIYVKHDINGRSLGLEKALPVDVYVNGQKAFTFGFGDSFSAELPAGIYSIDVKLAGTNTTVMSLGPVEIPAGADVTIKAQLSANKTPTLHVNVK